MKEFVIRFGGLMAALAAVTGCPFICSLVLSIGPPWPDQETAVSSWVAMVNIVVLVLVYNTKRSQNELWIKRLSVVFTTSLVVYVILMSSFCYKVTDSSVLVAGGFLPSEKTKQVMKENPEETYKHLLAQARFDPEEVWIPWTVRVVRDVILFVWLVLFASFSGVVALATPQRASD